MPEDSKEIFISYAWDDGEEFVERLDQAFSEKGVNLIRDKREIPYKGLINEFMGRIGRGKCIVVVISDKYLKSRYCMFELAQIAKNGKFYDRIFPIVLGNAQIYVPNERVNYVKYWEIENKKFEKSIKGVSFEYLQSFSEDSRKLSEIRNTIGELTSLLSNMNTLTPDIHSESGFETLIQSINAKLSEHPLNSINPLSEPKYPVHTDISIPAFDNILQEKNSALFSMLQEVRETLLPHLASIPITAYSHDSVHHAKQTLSYLTEAYLPALKNTLTPEEVFVLGVFAHVHDVGMKPHGSYTLEQIYSHHTHKAYEFIEEYLNYIPHKSEIQALCLVHNKSLDQAKPHFDHLENEGMRLSIILSMFRISDMLDVEIQPGPEAIEPIYSPDLMLRIDGRYRGRCIADISINPEKREIHITKEEYTESQVFHDWIDVFSKKFKDYNQALSTINCKYKIKW
jgi:hypothetical protein